MTNKVIDKSVRQFHFYKESKTDFIYLLFFPRRLCENKNDRVFAKMV